MLSFRPGERVLHPEYGSGSVVKKRISGRALVRFDSETRLPVTVRRSDLIEEVTSAAESVGVDENVANESDVGSMKRATKKTTKKRATKKTTRRRNARRPDDSAPSSAANGTSVPIEKADAFQILEALRLGVVPHDGVEAFTIGRDVEIASIDTALRSGRGCRVMWGDYGTGKTHLLELAEQKARREGYATAAVTLDPNENALQHPLRLYRRIAETIQLPDRATGGLDAIFERLVDSPAHNFGYAEDGSRFFSPYLWMRQFGDEEMVGWFRDYVHGDNIDVPPLRAMLSSTGWRGPGPLKMSDYRTYGRMYVHLIGTLSCWAQDAGAKGLVLAFDEVERIDAADSTARHYALEVLKHYVSVTMRSDDLCFDPEEELYRGGHSVHRDLPLEFRDDQPLVIFFALTPLTEIRSQFRELTESTAYDIEIRPLSPNDLPELIRRIGRLYQIVYPHFDVDTCQATLHDECRAVVDEGAGFRAAVRTAVDLFDRIRLTGA